MIRLIRFALLAALGFSPALPASPRQLAKEGRSTHVIRVCAEPTPAERHAAAELQVYLEKITGARLPVQAGGALPAQAILVGRDAEADKLAPDVDWKALGGEGFIVRTSGPHLVLAGGRPRGTLYAVYSFLDEELGCRWLAPDCERIPARKELVVQDVQRTFVPRLEYRETFSASAFDGDWAARNLNNGHSPRLAERHGGKTIYEGFVHTFFPLLPPEKHFAAHPEWYSERGGKRYFERGQLCLTNPDVVRAMIEAVRERLRKNPQATIVSVSQNDWHGACECAACKAVDAEEGSPSGALIRFVNQVAEAIEPQFPQVAIDTLAYQYTRKPPRLARPRPNVIVRLCSIECCFTHPLESCPENAAFVNDIVGWSKICNRLYVWDYVTNFAHYLLPHPNLDVLEPNIRFFVNHGVKGIFEQGEYQSPGGELLELRSYVIARLLRNPDRSAREAMGEFLAGYYGPAADPVGRFIRLLHDKVAKDNIHLRCYAQPNAACFTPELIAEADRLLEEAGRLAAKAGDPALLQRVRLAHLPVQYVMLERGRAWSREAIRSGRAVGPFGPGWSDRALADRFLATASAARISRVSEAREFDVYRARLQTFFDRKAPSLPPGTEKLPSRRWIDVQDDEFSLFRDGDLCGIRADASASDGGCAWLKGSTPEWAVQFQIPPGMLEAGKRYALHSVVKVRRIASTAAAGGAAAGEAFSWGLYDTEAGKSVASARVPSGAAAPDWKAYALPAFAAKGKPYVWFSGSKSASPGAEILIDRIYLVEEGP